MDYSPLYLSLKITILATVIASAAGLATAYYMSKWNGRFKGIVDGLLNLPLVLPPMVMGFFLLMLLGRYGMIGGALSKIGTEIIFTPAAAIIAAAVVAFPLIYKTVYASFMNIDCDLIAAARTMGASEGDIFFKIILPLSGQGIAAGCILAFARALGEFGATLMIAGNIPGKTQTIPLAIYFMASGGDMDKALLWVVILTAISVGAIYSMNHWLKYKSAY